MKSRPASSKIRRYVSGQKQFFLERRAVFAFDIPHFASLGPGAVCLSEEFRAYGHTWQVRVMPYGVDEHNIEGSEAPELYTSVHLIHKSSRDAFVKYTLTLLCARGAADDYTWSDGPLVFRSASSADNMWGCEDFVHRSEISQYLNNDTLQLRVEINLIEIDELRVSDRMAEVAAGNSGIVEEETLRSVQELRKMMPRMRLLTEDKTQQDRLVMSRLSSTQIPRAASTSSLRRVPSSAIQEKLRHDSIRSIDSNRSNTSRPLIRADSNGSMISRQVPTSARDKEKQQT